MSPWKETSSCVGLWAVESPTQEMIPGKGACGAKTGKNREKTWSAHNLFATKAGCLCVRGSPVRGRGGGAPGLGRGSPGRGRGAGSSRLRLRSRPRWCRRWRSRRAVGRVRACWAVQGEEAPGRGFFAVWVVVFPRFGGFACLSVWFGRMIPGLYEVIQYTLSLSPVLPRRDAGWVCARVRVPQGRGRGCGASAPGCSSPGRGCGAGSSTSGVGPGPCGAGGGGLSGR